MSEVLCSGVTLAGTLASSWRSFKLLKRRGELRRELAVAEARGGARRDGAGEVEDEDEVMGVKLEAFMTRKEVREILKFWVVLALLRLYESYAEILFFWVPFYYTVKLALLVWTMAPHSRGADVIFESLVEPHFDARYEWIEESVLPRARVVLVALQDALAAGFVNLSISFGSDENLASTKDQLRHMLARVEAAEQERRRSRRRSSAGRLDDLRTHDLERKLMEAQDLLGPAAGTEAQAGPGWGGAMASWIAAASTAVLGGRERGASSVGGGGDDDGGDDGGGSAGGAMGLAREEEEKAGHGAGSSDEGSDGGIAAQEQPRRRASVRSVRSVRSARSAQSVRSAQSSEAKAGEAGLGADLPSPRSPRSGWMRHALDGVAGFTSSTRDALLGRRRYHHHHHHRRREDGRLPGDDDGDDDDDDDVDEKRSSSPELVESPGVGDDGVARAEEVFAKYSHGFDALSDCEDSDSASCGSLAHASSRAARHGAAGPGANSAPRRPVTRSQRRR